MNSLGAIGVGKDRPAELPIADRLSESTEALAIAVSRLKVLADALCGQTPADEKESAEYPQFRNFYDKLSATRNLVSQSAKDIHDELNRIEQLFGLFRLA